MSKTFRSTVAFAAATIAVFGVVYLIDGAGLKPLNKPKPVQEIKGSVGPVWTVGDGAALESPDDDSTGKAQSGAQTSLRAQCDAWEKHGKELDAFALGSSSGAEQDRIRQAQRKLRQKMLDLDCMRA